MKTCIVIPCYNEARRLPGAEFLAYAKGREWVRFLFVNDGSTDETAKVLEELCARAPERLRWLDAQPNGGKAEAVRRGMLAALETAAADGVEAIGFWDADLATPLAEIERFAARLAEQPALELVMGSRVNLMGRRIERKQTRHYLGRLFATAVSLLFKMYVYDTQCGAKLFRATPRLERLLAEPFTSRWIFDVELLIRLRQSLKAEGTGGSGRNPELDFAVHELPLNEWRDVAGSKIGGGDFFKCAADVMRIRRRYGR